MKSVVGYCFTVYLLLFMMFAIYHLRVSLPMLNTIYQASPDKELNIIKNGFLLELFAGLGLIIGIGFFIFLKPAKWSRLLIVLSLILLSLFNLYTFYFVSGASEIYFKKLILNLVLNFIPVIFLIHPKIITIYGWK